MRIHVRSDIALKDDEGMIRFGRTEWIEKNKIRLSADTQPMPGSMCDLTMELGQGQARVAAAVRIVGVEPLGRGQFQLDCRIEHMTERDRTRYAYFLNEQSRSVSSVRSAQHIRGSGASGANRTQGRASVKRGLKSGLSRARTPATPPPAPPAAADPVRDPTLVVDNEQATITLRWSSSRIFQNDFEASLRKGTWTLRSKLPQRANVTLRLETPDGQVVSLPAKVQRANSATYTLAFRLGLALKTKLRKAGNAA